MILIALAFAVNVAVTWTLVVLFARDVPRMAEVYGADAPARRILGCLYGAIGLVSVIGLGLMAAERTEAAAAMAVGLFPVQIAYKLATAHTVGLLHPVVLANLAITALLVPAWLAALEVAG